METYSGIPAENIGFKEFAAFTWREKRRLFRFLLWTGEMARIDAGEHRNRLNS
jgi:hypothetical protein